MTGLSKLLVLSASYGAGHEQAAIAVRDALLKMSPETDVRIVDYMHHVHPTLDSIVKYCYLKSVRYAPALYGWFYKGTSQIPPSSLIQRQLNSLGIEDLAAELETYNPDVVFSTFPTPAGVVSYLRQQGRTNVPSATVITDHAIHSQWIHPQTDMYFVGSQHVKNGLMARGIPGETVHVTGIPVRPGFLQAFDKAQLCQKYGLMTDVPIVLVMGGAYGVMGDIQQICEELFTYPHPVQTLVVTGRNERMAQQLSELLPSATNPAKVFGYVSEVYELMAIADLVLTKAGGLTISEAVAMQLPMLLYRPIPGQEVQNAKFLVRSGVAVLARNRKQVSERLHELIVANPGRISAMRRRTLHVRKLNAAESIAEKLLDLASFRKNRAYYSYR
ncbi:MGDG synthase family glycosyltransferase [Alicyclobacillus mengziensis]|uniref:Processive 1,2-diacylglycerol beta-glucosyltransferase n=1 Tax=Alicyclobacillus mengziensis TaxID=2931921 RepID=A0A9X7Z650_9BACL|nr:glycosyltransferase [Alicyclobacillus mengziensis]QSO47599.1 hypothetical protein JZ786_00590 [Alicyclobacillus mengziensis]